MQRLEQLRSKFFPTRDAAIKELKRNGFPPKGDDYEVRQHGKGWVVAELDDAAQAPASMASQGKPPRLIAKAQKAAVAKKNGTAASPPRPGQHAADVIARKLIETAASYAVHFRVSPKAALNETATTLVEAARIAERMNAKHGKHGRRAMIYAVPQGKGASVPIPADMLPQLLESNRTIASGVLKLPARTSASPTTRELMEKAPVTKLPERTARGIKRSPQAQRAIASTAALMAKAPPAKQAPVETPPPAEPEPANDLAQPPTADGPYTLRIGAKEHPQFNLPTLAHHFSVQTGQLIEIVSKAGKVVNTIDGRIPLGKRPPRTQRAAPAGGNGAGRPPRAANGETKAGRAAALLARPEGATMAEIRAVTEWPPGMRTLRSWATSKGGALETIAKHHWRIVTPPPSPSAMRRAPRKWGDAIA